jgi:hypothetical protein
MATESPKAAPTSQQALTEFHPFPRLPIELQDAIWNLTLPPPQIISIDREILYSSELAHMS